MCIYKYIAYIDTNYINKQNKQTDRKRKKKEEKKKNIIHFILFLSRFHRFKLSNELIRTTSPSFTNHSFTTASRIPSPISLKLNSTCLRSQIFVCILLH